MPEQSKNIEHKNQSKLRHGKKVNSLGITIDHSDRSAGLKKTIIGKNDPDSFSKNSVQEFAAIIDKVILSSTMNSEEKLRNMILLQTLYSIKALNLNSQSPETIYQSEIFRLYEKAVESIKDYYLNIFLCCRNDGIMFTEKNHEKLFQLIQESILNQYLKYYKTGEISAMLDYMDEVFEKIITQNNK